MTQQELEALLAQFGVLGAGDFREETKIEEIPNPASTANGGTENVPPTMKGPVVYRTWVKPGTNQRLTVRVDGDNTYTKTFQGSDPDIKTSTTTPRTPSQEAADALATRQEAERARNRGLPRDQDPADETDDERRTRAQATIDRQGREARDAETRQRQAAQDAQQAADRNKPGAPTLKPDGKGGTVAVQTMPDGSIKTTPLPGVPSDKPNPDRVTVEGVVYERGPDGVYAPAQGLPTAGAGVRNVPTFTPDYARPEAGLGLMDYVAELRKKVGLPAAQGGITEKEFVDAVTLARADAQTAMTAATSAAETERQTLTAQRAETARRQAQASSDFTSAQNANKDIWKYTAPGQATLDTMAYGSVAANRGVQAMYGGTQEVPYPTMLNPWVERMRAQLQGGAVGPPPAGERQEPLPGHRPLASVVSAPALAAPPVMDPAAAAAAQMANPVFRPPPPVTGPMPGPDPMSSPAAMAPGAGNAWAQQAATAYGGQLDPGSAAMSLRSIGIPDDIIGQVLGGGIG
jgi:hypothetical protein